MIRARVSLCVALVVALAGAIGPIEVEAKKKDRCEGTKKQRKQKMEPRDLTQEQIEELIEQYNDTVDAERNRLLETGLRRLEREYEDHKKNGTPFVHDVLVISGGGSKGAFGSGFLEGWGEVTGPYARPEFDTVTGVSTGALIAPFAFIGTDEAYHGVSEFYANPEPNWIKKRGTFYFLPKHVSLYNDCHLQDTIRGAVDRAMVEAMAQGAAEDRLLLVGVTNLDAGRGRVFDLSHEAQEALESGSFDRVHSMLLASSALPGVFPPVEIDGLYFGDGGATSNIFVVIHPRHGGPIGKFRELHPEAPPPKIRVWILINQQLQSQAAVTEPRWLSVTGRALDTLMSSSQLWALKLIDQIAEDASADYGIDVEFRYVAIPDDAPRNETTDMFDRDYMIALEELGREMGADPASWRTDIPSPYWSKLSD